jgi:hypothetical protein
MNVEFGKILQLYPFELIEFLQKNNQAHSLKGGSSPGGPRIQERKEADDDEEPIEDINFTIVDLRMEKNDNYLPFTIDIPAAAHSNPDVRAPISNPNGI